MVRYLETFFRLRLVLVLPLVLSMGAAGAIVMAQPVTYTATSRLWFDYPLYGPMAASADTYTPPSQAQASTFNELLRTRTFTLRAGNRGPLRDYLAHSADPSLAGRLLRGLGLATNAPATSGALDDAVAAAVGAGTHVSYAGSEIVIVTFKFTNASVAAGALQGIVDEFADEELASQRAQAQSAVDFYSGQLSAASTDLSNDETAIVSYVSAHPEQRSANPPPDAALAQLRFNADIAQQRYEGLRTKVQQLQLQLNALRTPADLGMQLIDQPTPPTQHDSRSKLLAEAVGGGLVCGLVLMLLALLVLTTVDSAIRRGSEVVTLLDLPVIAEIPARRGAA